MSYLIPFPLDIEGVRAYLFARQERVLLQLPKGEAYDLANLAIMRLAGEPGIRQIELRDNRSLCVDIDIDHPDSLITLHFVAIDLVGLAKDYEADLVLGRLNP